MTFFFLTLFLGCSEYGVNSPPTPQTALTVVELTPSELDFGELPYQEQVQNELLLRNNGDTLLHVSDIVVEGSDAFELQLDEPLPWSLPPNTERPIGLVYTATYAQDIGWLHVLNDDLQHPDVEASLRGEALLPVLEVSPDPVDFGAQREGAVVTALLTLANIGTADLNIDATWIDQSQLFELGALELPLTLAPGEQTLTTLAYTATTASDRGTLSLKTNMPLVPVTVVPLEGRAAWPQLVVDPPVLDFADVDGCGVEVDFLTLRNEGEVVLTVDQIDFPPEVVPSATLPLNIPPGGSQLLRVTLAPGNSDYTGALVLHSDDPDGPVSVTAVSADQSMDWEVIPATMDFGAAQISCGSDDLVTLRNNGPGCLRVTGIDLPDGVALAPWARPVPYRLMPGEEAPIPLALTTDGTGLSAVAQIHTTAGSFELPVSAAPAAPVVIASDTDFGPSTACRSTGPLTLQNLGPGCAEVTALQLPEGVETATSFPLRLAPGESRDLTLIKTTEVALLDHDATALTTSPAGDAIFHLSTVGPAPSLIIDEPLVDFASGSGDACSPTYQTIHLRTDGTGCVRVTGASLPEGVSVAHWARPLPYVLQPGDVQPFPFYVDADLTWLDDTAYIRSSAPGGRTGVPALFTPPVADLVSSVERIDYGNVDVGCRTADYLFLSAENGGCATIRDMELPAGVRSALTPADFPIRVYSGRSVYFGLEAEGLPGGISGEAVFHRGDLGPPVTVPVSATSPQVASTPQTDTFEQLGGDKADILFWIDQSCSMGDDAQRVAANIDAFAATLATLQTDYQLMIVHSDTGCRLGDIWTPDSPNGLEDFKQHVTHSSDREAGLSTTEHALSLAGSSGCNAGFLRPDATTNAILVSDEPEQSNSSWFDLTSRILGYSPSTRIHGIVGGSGGSCSWSGEGYTQAVHRTGGLLLDICTDWAAQLSLVAEATTGTRQSFALSGIAVPSTILVDIDGVQQTSGWTYIQDFHMIRFDPQSIPLPGSVITVTYEAVPEVCN